MTDPWRHLFPRTGRQRGSLSILSERLSCANGFWVTFQPGEVRTCASCHGSNGEAAVPKQIIPQNKPEAFRTLLQYWKSSLLQAPPTPLLSLPANNAANQPYLLTTSWGTSTLASTYRFQLATDSLFNTILVDDSTLTGVSRR